MIPSDGDGDGDGWDMTADSQTFYWYLPWLVRWSKLKENNMSIYMGSGRVRSGF